MEKDYNHSTLDLFPHQHQDENNNNNKKSSPLTESQLQRVQDLESKVSAKFSQLSFDQQQEFGKLKTSFLVRHLIARTWNVNRALEMILETASWRNEFNIDIMPLFPPIVPVRGFDWSELNQLRYESMPPEILEKACSLKPSSTNSLYSAPTFIAVNKNNNNNSSDINNKNTSESPSNNSNRSGSSNNNSSENETCSASTTTTPTSTPSSIKIDKMNPTFPVRDTNSNASFIQECRQHFAHCASNVWHKWDKEGRPVYIERSGLFNVKELVERFKSLTTPGGNLSQIAIDLHIHSNEIGRTLLRYSNERGVALQRRKEGKASCPVSGVVVIMDCSELTISDHLYMPAMEVFKAQNEGDMSHYAEMLHKMYIVNCPGIITMFWNIVKLMLDERIRSKIRFCSPGEETKQALLEVIDEENLPTALGGKCQCSPSAISGDSCLPNVKKYSSLEESKTVLPLGPTKEIYVSAGKTESCEFFCFDNNNNDAEQKQEIEVDVCFSVPDHNILFEIKHDGKILAKSEDNNKVNSFSQTFKINKKGKFVITFDNTYSWMRSKTVLARCVILISENSQQ
jgi:hypothetical protein